MRSAVAYGLADSVSAAALTGRLNDEIRQSEQLHMELQFARQARADDAELVAKLDLQVWFGFCPQSTAPQHPTGIVVCGRPHCAIFGPIKPHD